MVLSCAKQKPCERAGSGLENTIHRIFLLGKTKTNRHVDWTQYDVVALPSRSIIGDKIHVLLLYLSSLFPIVA